MDGDLCVTACREAGGPGQLIVWLLVIGRWVWAEWKRRAAVQEVQQRKAEVVDLKEQLSLRPPSAAPGAPGLVLRIPQIALEQAGYSSIAPTMPAPPLDTASENSDPDAPR